MKLFRTCIAVSLTLAIFPLLSGCESQPDSLVSPKGESMDKLFDCLARTNGTYYIMRDGENNLVYTNQGRTLLSKIKGKGGDWNFVYGWGTKQTIGVLKYGVQDKLNPGCQQFILNDKGLCIEGTTDDHYFYEYNAKDQLVKCYSKYEPNKRLEFKYETNPYLKFKSLDKVEFYDKNNFKYKEILFGYIYGVPDLHKTNPDLPVFGICKYLPIFGVFNQYLLEHTSTIIYNPNGSSTQTFLEYDYLLDANGRAKVITVKKPYPLEIVSVIERNYSNHPTGL